MKQKMDAKYNNVLSMLAAETGKSVSRIQRLMTVAPNQGVIERFWEIFEEKYPDTDIETYSPEYIDSEGEMSLVEPDISNVTAGAHPPHCPDCGDKISFTGVDETLTIEYFGFLNPNER
jgi:hypothetical protein